MKRGIDPVEVRADEIFFAAMEIESDIERATYLKEACGAVIRILPPFNFYRKSVGLRNCGAPLGTGGISLAESFESQQFYLLFTVTTPAL